MKIHINIDKVLLTIINQLSMLQKLSKQFKITAQTVEAFASIVGDYNPVHLDEVQAAKSRFGRRIAHGMVGVSYLNAVLPFNIKCHELDIKFRKPIFLGEVIRIQVELNGEDKIMNGIIYKVKQIEKENNFNSKEIVTQITGKWKYQNLGGFQ